MNEYFEHLNEIRLEISQRAGEAGILFDKIQDSSKLEISYLAILGKKVCKEIIKNSEKLETAFSNRNKHK